MWHASSLQLLVIIYLTSTRWDHFHAKTHFIESKTPSGNLSRSFLEDDKRVH